ncbi:MAG: hypothetical protein EXS40_10130 [Opitutaceae bacterium]|nr:hypothetical protein [Opitutaceae bacterium]
MLTALHPCEQLTSIGQLHAAQSHRREKMVPMIIVLPWGHAVPFGGPGYNNGPFDRYLAKEVVPAVDTKFAPSPIAKATPSWVFRWAAAKRSAPASATSDLFASVRGYSAATIGDFTTRCKALLDDPTGTNAEPKRLGIACGRQGSLFASSERMAGTLSAAKVRHTFFPMVGLHHYVVWHRCFEETAPLLFR